MAQIASKLPSEAKPRMVNCNLGHSFFIAKDCILFFRVIRAFSPLRRKHFLTNKKIFYLHFSLGFMCHLQPFKRKKKSWLSQLVAVTGIFFQGITLEYSFFKFYKGNKGKLDRLILTSKERE